MIPDIIDTWAAAASPEDLRSEVKGWDGACHGIGDPGYAPADLCDWTYENAFPLERLLDHNTDWKAWVADEMGYGTQGRRDSMQDMLDNGVEDAVVLQVSGPANEAILIWDGWHRIGTSIIRGDAHIPAIVGRPNPDLVKAAGWDVDAGSPGEALEEAERVARKLAFKRKRGKTERSVKHEDVDADTTGLSLAVAVEAN